MLREDRVSGWSEPQEISDVDCSIVCEKGLKHRHLSMIAIGGVIGAGLFVGSGVVIDDAGPGAFLSYARHRRADRLRHADAGRDGRGQPDAPAPSPPTRARRWAVGRASPSAGSTGSSGSSCSPSRPPRAPDPGAAGSGRAAVADGADPDAADDRHQPDLGGLLRRVRVLVRRHQGRRDRGLPGARRPLRARASWPDRGMDFSNLTAHGGFFPNGVGAIFSGSSWSSSPWSARRSPPSPPPSPTDPGAPSPGPPTPWCCGSRIFYVGSVFLLACMLPWNSRRAGRRRRTSAAFEIIGIPGADRRHERGGAHRGAVLPQLRASTPPRRMLFVLAAREEAPDRAAHGQRQGRPGAGDPVLRRSSASCA